LGGVELATQATGHSSQLIGASGGRGQATTRRGGGATPGKQEYQIRPEVAALLRKRDIKKTTIEARPRGGSEASAPKPVPLLDKDVWATYTSGQAAGKPAPVRLAEEITRLIDKSVRYLNWKHGTELKEPLKLTVSWETDNGEVLWRGWKVPGYGTRRADAVAHLDPDTVIVVKFYLHPPMERGARVARRRAQFSVRAALSKLDFDADDQTLAKAAHKAGVGPEQLENRGRDHAADLLRRILGDRAAPVGFKAPAGKAEVEAPAERAPARRRRRA
jgi:hypothetical protein